MNDTTKRLIDTARAKDPAERTRADKVLIMLARGSWVSAYDLAFHGGGLRFGGRIHDLRSAGVDIEARISPDSPTGENWWEYRLAQSELIAQ